METMTKKAKASEEFCYSCERLLLTPDEKLGPVCGDCFKKTKKPKDPLTRAAIRQTLVAVVPMVCPHENERRHRCRTRFSVIVLDKRLEPVEITGPYSMSAAERYASRVRRRHEGRK